MLHFLGLISILMEKYEHVHAKKLKVQDKSKHAKGERKAHLQGAELHKHDCQLFSVHIPVDQPDIHELHVHIHEGK